MKKASPSPRRNSCHRPRSWRATAMVQGCGIDATIRSRGRRTAAQKADFGGVTGRAMHSGRWTAPAAAWPRSSLQDRCGPAGRGRWAGPVATLTTSATAGKRCETHVISLSGGRNLTSRTPPRSHENRSRADAARKSTGVVVAGTGSGSGVRDQGSGSGVRRQGSGSRGSGEASRPSTRFTPVTTVFAVLLPDP